MSQIIPIPPVPVTTRLATLQDLPFIDSLQKQHNRALGYFPAKQLQEYVETAGVLVAESDGRAIGYCISRDRYLKRDELGVIYQLCVTPGQQRKLIGAALVQAVFERSAYGCKLYCCWCAQDLEACYFWESLGFLPLAFRAGSQGRRRVHIFWQKRINEGDDATPYWYPCQTNAGAIRADRLVFPIPPGTHWKDVQAVAVPGAMTKEAPRITDQAQASRSPSTAPPPIRSALMPMSGFKFQAELSSSPRSSGIRPGKPKAARVKIDPNFLKLNRELRDRYLEQVNRTSNAPLLARAGKYDVTRAFAAPPIRPQLPWDREEQRGGELRVGS